MVLQNMLLQTNNLETSMYIAAAEAYVENLMQHHLPLTLHFHDFEHTQKVKTAAVHLGKLSGLNEEELEILSLAALFHDTGFIKTYLGHEEESQKIAESYLREVNYPEAKIEQVKKLIHVTKSDVIPSNLIEKVFSDADTSHLGEENYRSHSEKLWKERNQHFQEAKINELEWEEENFNFLQSHVYYTHAARKEYAENKLENLKKTKKRLKKAQEKQQNKLDEVTISKNKSAQTMFKTSLRNHIDLTSIADQKANMMLSITALILTIGMPVFASYLSEKTFLLVPSICFMLTCILTMVFATLSTRPIKMSGTTDLTKISSGKTNLFFFGNFYNFKLDEYHGAIKQILADQENLDNSIINDLYYLGHSLGDKFRHLRTCYNIFIIGMIISLIAFIISFGIYNGE